MAQRYRKRPIEVEAVQWNGLNTGEITGFLGANFVNFAPAAGNEDVVVVFKNTLHGSVLTVTPGMWVVKGDEPGDYWPVAENVFSDTYMIACQNCGCEEKEGEPHIFENIGMCRISEPRRLVDIPASEWPGP